MDLRTTLQAATYTQHHYQGGELVARQVTGPRREATTVFLLSEHNIKLSYTYKLIMVVAAYARPVQAQTKPNQIPAQR